MILFPDTEGEDQVLGGGGHELHFGYVHTHEEIWKGQLVHKPGGEMRDMDWKYKFANTNISWLDRERWAGKGD